MPGSKTTVMTRAQAARILRKARLITALARELGCNRVTVSAVLRGHTASTKILAAAIRKAMQVTAEAEL